jgi:hypothetical protein
MTHEERISFLESQPGETISPTVAARILGGSAYAYNLTAKEGKLRIPHIWRGRNLRILKTPLLKLIRDGSDVTSSLWAD